MNAGMPETLEASYDRLLGGVQKPFRYIGGEWNAVAKDHRGVDLTVALAFPDVYEIGMSHLGFRILYALLNDRHDVAAERVFCPWPDMAGALRRQGRPLATLETRTPVREFDVVGFSLQYELTFTNVLEMLDLAGIPLLASQRGEADPLVIAGGPVVFSVEPLAEFLDLVLVGDGEELLPELLTLLKTLKHERVPRAERVRALARIEGVYAPSLYRVEAEPERGLLVPVPSGDAVFPVRRRFVEKLDRFPFPSKIVVAHGEIVHDRVSVEIMRGCPVGCRFCQAGYVYRPVRERHPAQVRDVVVRSLGETGYDEFSLASLNTGEYGAIEPLLLDLMDSLEPRSVSVSLSSLHASTLTQELAEQVRRVRKSGFTIAPEAGSQRLRDVINKNLSEEQILEACRLAFEAGWGLLKLYFMIGLPTETDEDVDAVSRLAHEVLASGRRAAKSRRIEVTVSASSFVPKPATPFQWAGMNRAEELRRKQSRLASQMRRGVTFKHHDTDTSFLEAVFSRGDRRLGEVLGRAWRLGARFDGWAEHFDSGLWRQAFRDAGVDPERYAYGDWDTGQRLPWDVFDTRVDKAWLARDFDRARGAETLTVCGPEDCHGCGSFARACVQGLFSQAKEPGAGTAVEHAIGARGIPASADTGSATMGPTQDDAEGRYVYRARFTKTGRIRFLGHLDMARTLLRAMRRAGIPLSYSRGFNPKPRVAFGPALPVGVASEGEYLDFETTERLEADEAAESINGCLPDGVRFVALAEIRRDTPSIADATRAARYRLHTQDPLDLEVALNSLAGGDPLTTTREKRGRTRVFDVREQILSVEPRAGGELIMTLALGGADASIRPEEVLRALFGERHASVQIVREDLLQLWNGRWLNPLLAATVTAGHAQRAPR
jgi:radical SAM family uncharacterized protein/radical SAM-linked protein